MDMLQRMETYTLERCTTEKNDLLEDVKIWKEIGKIRAAVSVSTGSTLETNQIQRISSTHKAITPDDVRAGDRFGGYTVDFAIPGRIYTQLYMTREDASK